jgi:hypothetical protein
MTLEDDLGITGDDAVDLFKDFVKQFPEVALDCLDLSLHFAPEAGRPSCMHGRSPLTVEDLVIAAREKCWRGTAERTPNNA